MRYILEVIKTTFSIGKIRKNLKKEEKHVIIRILHHTKLSILYETITRDKRSPTMIIATEIYAKK